MTQMDADKEKADAELVAAAIWAEELLRQQGCIYVANELRDKRLKAMAADKRGPGYRRYIEEQAAAGKAVESTYRFAALQGIWTQLEAAPSSWDWENFAYRLARPNAETSKS